MTDVLLPTASNSIPTAPSTSAAFSARPGKRMTPTRAHPAAPTGTSASASSPAGPAVAGSAALRKASA